MNERNTWGWIIGVVAVLLIIGGVWWYMAGPTAGTPTDTATTTVATTTGTTGTNPSTTGASLVNRSGESVNTIIASLPNASQYAAYYAASGVGATLGKGPYTVFVSTDAGYALLKPGTITNMTTAQKKRMVQYSIVSGKALDIDAQETGTIKALSGDKLNFSVKDSGQVQVNSSFALTQYKGSNGIVYVINQPLIPPTGGDILTP